MQTDKRHKMNIYAVFMNNYAKSICSCSLYYIIYIPLYNYIFMPLCDIILWYTMVICFNAIICNYRDIILCDTA